MGCQDTRRLLSPGYMKPRNDCTFEMKNLAWGYSFQVQFRETSYAPTAKSPTARSPACPTGGSVSSDPLRSDAIAPTDGFIVRRRLLGRGNSSHHAPE